MCRACMEKDQTLKNSNLGNEKSARPYVVPYRVSRELNWKATNFQFADLVSTCLSETQFETFQEISDLDFCLGSSGSQLSCTRLRVPPVALHVSRYTCRT